MSDLVTALREFHLASGDKLQMIYDDAEKQSAEARRELAIFKQGALARIEALEAELEWMTKRALCGEVVISGCHTTIAQLAAEIETAKMERFVVDDDLAESRHVNARLNEEHRDLAETLAAANAKIARVEEACEDTYCYDADDTHDPLDRCVNEVIGDIRAALADPAPQESHAGSLAGSTIQAKDDQC